MFPRKKTVHGGSRAQNPRWRPSTRYGTPNFFPMGDKFKILFSRIGFWVLAMQWNHFQCCARGIFTKFGEFDDFLRFLRIFPQFIIILTQETLFLELYPYFGLDGIKWRHLQNCQTTRVARLHGILTLICYFLQVLTIFHRIINILTSETWFLWLWPCFCGPEIQ